MTTRMQNYDRTHTSAEDFVRWAKSRANHALAVLEAAPTAPAVVAMSTPNNIWTRCVLEGAELDAAVARLLGLSWRFFEDGVVIDLPDDPLIGPDFYRFSPSCYWNIGGPIIEKNQIFLNPPHDMHVHGARWTQYVHWTATVSARVRTYPNPLNPEFLGCVGRGIGPTPLIAAMRAFVASFGDTT